MPHKALAEVSKKSKPIGEVGCCESRMAERSHWWTERWLRSPLFLSLSLTTYLPTYPSIYLSLSLSLPPLSSIYLSIYLPTYLSIYLSVCLSVYLSICLSASLKTGYSARLPQFLNLTTSKAQQFSETSSIFALDSIKNEAIPRDFLIF